MSGEREVREILFDLRRDIQSGVYELTVMEEGILRSLQAVFPQHSTLSLSAVVALHSQRYCYSVETLLTECIEFMLNDGDYLKDFSRAGAGDEDPDTNGKGEARNNADETSLSSSIGLNSVIQAALNSTSSSSLPFAAKDSGSVTPTMAVSSPTLSCVSSSLPCSSQFHNGKEGDCKGEDEFFRSSDSQKSSEGSMSVEHDDSSRESLPDVNISLKPAKPSLGLMNASSMSANVFTGNDLPSSTENCDSRICSRKNVETGSSDRTTVSILKDSEEGDWSEPSRENLPLLYLPKKKRWSIQESANWRALKDSPSAPSSSSDCDLGDFSGSLSSSDANSVCLDKKSPCDSSTKTQSHKVTSAGCSSLKYLGKRSFTSSSVTVPGDEIAAANSSNVECFGKQPSSDYLMKTASHKSPSTSIDDLTDSGKMSPQSSITGSPSHEISFKSGSGWESKDEKSANNSSSSLHLYPSLISPSSAHVDALNSLEESADLRFPVEKQERSAQPVEFMVTAPPASATGDPPVPDSRSDILKRMDTLDARIQGLNTSADSLSTGLHALKPQTTVPSTHVLNLQQSNSETQDVLNRICPIVTVPSPNKTVVTHCCPIDQPKHCTFGHTIKDKMDSIQPATSGVAILSLSQNNSLETKSQLVETEGSAQNRQSNKAHPACVSSGNVNITPPHNRNSFTAIRDPFDKTKTSESHSQFSSQFSAVDHNIVKQAQPDLKKHKVDLKPSMLNVQPGSVMQQLVPTLQQPRPVLQQPKLILPDIVQQQPRSILQPAKLNLQQHGPVVQPSEMHTDQPLPAAQHLQRNMPLAQQVLFKRQQSQHGEQQLEVIAQQAPLQDEYLPQPFLQHLQQQLSQSQQGQILQPQQDQIIFDPHPVYVDPAPVLQDRQEDGVVIIDAVPANITVIEDYAAHQVNPVGTVTANSIVTKDNAPPLVDTAGIVAVDDIVIEDYALPHLEPEGTDVVVTDVYAPPQVDLAGTIPADPIVIDNTPIWADPVPQPSTSAPVAHLGPADAHPGLFFGVHRVLEVFPTADRGHIRQLLEHFLANSGLDQALNQTMEHLLENPPPEPEEPEVTVVQVENTSNRGRDYYKQYDDVCTYSKAEVADRLSMEFRNVRLETVHSALEHYNYHYAPAYRCLNRALETAMTAQQVECKESMETCKKPSSKRLRSISLKFNEGQSNEVSVSFPLMKGLRGFNKKKMHVSNADLNAEIEFIAQQSKLDKEEMDRKMAWTLLESEYEEEGQFIECGCCYAEHPFENLVQCFDGHLFCCQCLQGYAREAVFGSGKLNLSCMTADCDSAFPKSQLLKALTDDDMQKYEERMTEENLNKAAMEDLVRCPSCNIAVVLDTHVQHFKCPNSICRKETCRDCKQDWSEHRGKTCDQVEKKDETKLRTNYEEKMTAARVRTCQSCQAQFTKEEGCNKMTCRCGATMCYICRKHQISYMHFCRHPRDPGMDCTSCKKCSLWSNPEEDEQRAIAEIQREAQEKRKAEGFLDEKLIGAPDEPVCKKLKL